MRSVHALGVAALVMLALPDSSFAEPKSGGILRMYHRDSPGSASIHEGATYSINVPFMAVFNNLVPVFGVSLAALMLGEQVMASMIAGGLLVATGVTITNR